MRELKGAECEDIFMHNLTPPPPNPTAGTIPYQGLAHADGKAVISFEVYIPNVVNAIESYCFCQDEIISNDWNIHMFRDGTYPGHPVIPGGVKLPTGGPRSGRTWQERVRELTDHCAHTRNLIHVVETVLSTRMLAEATYSGRYDDVNPFFLESEARCLNSYATVAEAHGESEFASVIIDALLMPFPDEDTISVLTESRLLDVGSVHDILCLAFDRDLVLGIAQTRLVTVATSPFRSKMFEDPFLSDKWYVLSDIVEEEEQEPKSKSKKFFL
ncbi:hypothetical protein DFJ58DRAFT_736960 [Suillus subalutaceus]|uniref:uncharacterized protein n=1 Tax=Suillus subalutaceus TaxID=48586 RepID=UPI001B87C2FD|nr:uncharacterized protein DFJ58DRAFT_736960 [Suillus subalutaceus]KAG1830488.1 hypothetical protein DFJ58DRAFT_736960 [Suillus subalutaceus]